MTTCQYSTILFLRSSPWTWVQHSSVTQLRIFDITEDPNLTQSVSDVRASCSVDSSTNRLLSSVHFAFIYHVFRATLKCLVERGTVTPKENSAGPPRPIQMSGKGSFRWTFRVEFCWFWTQYFIKMRTMGLKTSQNKIFGQYSDLREERWQNWKGPWQFDDEIIGNQMDSTCSIHEDKNCTQTFHWQ